MQCCLIVCCAALTQQTACDSYSGADSSHHSSGVQVQFPFCTNFLKLIQPKVLLPLICHLPRFVFSSVGRKYVGKHTFLVPSFLVSPWFLESHASRSYCLESPPLVLPREEPGFISGKEQDRGGDKEHSLFLILEVMLKT